LFGCAVKLCYLDESGDTGLLPSATAPIQPVFVIAGLIVNQAALRAITLELLQLKVRYFPGRGAATGHYLDRVKTEIKGAELRRAAVGPSRRKRTHAIGFLDQCMALLERREVRIVGRVWVKAIGRPMSHRGVYTSSVQAICRYFEHHLAQAQDAGFVIADSRDKEKNAIVAHSIFTQKFQLAGDRYPRVLEMPTYGHSENHVGLQLADLICSALLFPMAVSSYCVGAIANLHVLPEYSGLRRRYGQRLKALQYRYLEAGRHCGGIVVSDDLARRSGRILFEGIAELQGAP
jgi:hypothetical protein